MRRTSGSVRRLFRAETGAQARAGSREEAEQEIKIDRGFGISR